MSTAVYWFRYDLRLQDNSGWSELAESHTHILGIYVLPQRWLQLSRYGSKSIAPFRLQFLLESLQDLRAQLRGAGSELLVLEGDPATEIVRWCKQLQVKSLAVGDHPGSDEREDVAKVQQTLNISIIKAENFTLFKQAELPFDLNNLPDIFSQFRKRVENLPFSPPLPKPIRNNPATELPCQLDRLYAQVKAQLNGQNLNTMIFSGGTTAAERQLNYFLHESHQIATYKETRNQLDGWTFSSKLSPWLALGCISARQVAEAIQIYEREVQANESTYWLYFELLWREYFQWLGFRYGKQMFALKGIQNKDPQLNAPCQRLTDWCQGNTKSAFINAFMRQLLHTGWMSNRGRQIVASYLINELGVDWRYGAAWFEQQLIDYDVASNWGNWQYLAGVGTDPRGRRHFNITKQQQTYDPDFRFTQKWT